MDFLYGRRLVKKSKAVSDQKISLFPVLFIIKPFIVLRPGIFKIRQKALGSDEKRTYILLFKGTFSVLKTFLVFKHCHLGFKHHACKSRGCSP